MPNEGLVFELKGTSEMHEKLAAIDKLFRLHVSLALRGEAERIMTTSKQRYVPVDTGPLRASGHVRPVKRNGNDVEVTMAFGGPSAPYALAIHEHPSKFSPPSWQGKPISGIKWNIPGTGPKYLELPMRAAIPGMEQRIAERLKL